MAMAEYAKGICPDCKRVISGRATGIEADHADRRWVELRPHNREERSRHPVACLSRGGRRVVPRIRDVGLRPP
jgi:hypothetical protein